jgi:hypothetical protein
MEERPNATYLILLSVQIIGASFFIWEELPTFRQLTLSPGKQFPYVAYDDFAAIGTLVVMQVAYWYRLMRVPIPSFHSNLLLNHSLLFLGRLSFIFGGALFSVAFFRHLPQLDQGAEILVTTSRGMLLVGSLFALFCFSLELERLGRSLESNTQN